MSRVTNEPMQKNPQRLRRGSRRLVTILARRLGVRRHLPESSRRGRQVTQDGINLPLSMLTHLERMFVWAVQRLLENDLGSLQGEELLVDGNESALSRGSPCTALAPHQHRLDLAERQTGLLPEPDESQSAHPMGVVNTAAVRPSVRVEQSAPFVVAQRRWLHTEGAGQFPDRPHGWPLV